MDSSTEIKYNPDLFARPLTLIILMTFLSLFWPDRDLHYSFVTTKTRERFKSVTCRLMEDTSQGNKSDL